MIELISCGDSLRSGSYQLHSKFDSALNFVNGSQLAMLVLPRIGRGPHNIVLNCFPPHDIDSITIASNSLCISDVSVAIPPAAVYSSNIRLQPDNNSLIYSRLNEVKEFFIHHAHEKSLAFLLEPSRLSNFSALFDAVLAERFLAALELIRGGRIIEGMSLVKGLGHGLTPAGDDFIVGYLYALHLRKFMTVKTNVIVDDFNGLLTGANHFTNCFLYCAINGKAGEGWNNFLMAVCGSGKSYLSAAEKVLRSGTTSGADTMTGFLIGMEKQD